MQEGWIEDQATIQAIDDLLMTIHPHIDDVLSRLFEYRSTPTLQPDVILFGVIGPFVMAYAHARQSEPPPDAFHRGLSSVLKNPQIVDYLRSTIVRHADNMVEGDIS